MHGQKWTGQNIAGWYASEKLDGFRCVWTGYQFFSRNGKLFNTPQWFLKGMPKLPLDGELWAGRGRTHDDVWGSVAAGKWEQLHFCPFDIPQPEMTVEEAQAMLARLKLPGHCQRVVLRPVISTEAGTPDYD